MTKIALVVLGISILFGLFELAFSDEIQNAEDLGPELREDPNVEDRLGSQANAKAKVLIRPTAFPSSLSPTTNPFNLVECYACTDCHHILPNTTIKMCPFTMDPKKQGRCVVYAEKYQHIKQPLYIRGCASERSTCAEIRRAHDHNDIVRLVSCNECEGNRCNTNDASRSIVDFTIAFISVIVTPLVAKHALS